MTLRIAACCAARDLNRQELTPIIVDLATNDPSHRVRLWAIQTLKSWGHNDWKVLTIDFQAPRRLNPYERADWLLLRKYALGLEKDPQPRSTANACCCHP